MAASIHDLTRPPLAGGDIWTAVMTAAGWRCECTGECGRQHIKSGHRCPIEHGVTHRLVVAPTDPATPFSQAMDAPQSAWCPPCHDAAGRRARATAGWAQAEEQLDLFGGDAA